MCSTSVGILMACIQLLSSCLCERYDSDYDPSDDGLALPQDKLPMARGPSINQGHGPQASSSVSETVTREPLGREPSSCKEALGVELLPPSANTNGVAP